MPRALMWIVAVYLPCAAIGSAALVAYAAVNFPVAGGNPWWQAPPIVLWGVYMAAVSEVMMCMVLFLPRAPRAVQDAVVDVGLTWVGMALAVATSVAVGLAPTWLLVVLDCVYLVLIAAVAGLWVRLYRAYGTVRDDNPDHDSCRVLDSSIA
ncbi:hypothetical protein U9M48_004555 [Paspalum notatum var. saurae]|uniref:DUF7378 domain-containing protein n=1 Tax=Paspalum notatum var. saurae TaxID=547442 RepID=A0AAQ3SLD1_PASNO